MLLVCKNDGKDGKDGNDWSEYRTQEVLQKFAMAFAVGFTAYPRLRRDQSTCRTWTWHIFASCMRKSSWMPFHQLPCLKTIHGHVLMSDEGDDTFGNASNGDSRLMRSLQDWRVSDAPISPTIPNSASFLPAESVESVDSKATKKIVAEIVDTWSNKVAKKMATEVKVKSKRFTKVDRDTSNSQSHW